MRIIRYKTLSKEKGWRCHCIGYDVTHGCGAELFVTKKDLFPIGDKKAFQCPICKTVTIMRKDVLA
jgi:hypothetical protein